MSPWILGCLLAGFGLSADAGERIIFSSRDGRQVRFDYSRSVRLLPPEVEEGGFNKSADIGSGSLMPFGDPSMSPSSMRRRKMLPKSGNRDWIFANPEEEGRPKTGDPIDALEEEENEESAMLKFMNGESRDGTDEGRESNSGDDDRDRSLTGRKRRGLDFRGLKGAAGTEMTPLQELEMQAGFTPVIEGQPELTRFLKEDFRRQEDARHRRNMADFRLRLSGPTRTPVGNVFGTDPSGHGVGGGPMGQRSISFDMNRNGTPSGPNASSARPGATIPGAFESRGTPMDVGGRNTFNKAEQRRMRQRKPLDMSIRKRDF